MNLNKSKGNMYGFVTHTWNPIKGKCSHNCSYCYMKRWGEQKPLRLDVKEFKSLGQDNYIFIGSSTDMFADNVPNHWIMKVLNHCKEYPNNQYLFQTKNPKRFKEYIEDFPEATVLCITMESNRRYDEMENSPDTIERYKDFWNLDWSEDSKMITIEPIMDFDLAEFELYLSRVNPFQINIGADSRGTGLPEPSKEKIEALIQKLEKFTKVFLKDNLGRLKK